MATKGRGLVFWPKGAGLVLLIRVFTGWCRRIGLTGIGEYLNVFGDNFSTNLAIFLTFFLSNQIITLSFYKMSTIFTGLYIIG